MTNTLQSFKDYLQLEKNYSPHTVNAYLNDIVFFQNFLQKEFEQNNLHEVNYSQIRSWIVSLVDDGISNTSVNRKVPHLNHFISFY
jgi:integrase/recombinase XerC